MSQILFEIPALTHLIYMFIITTNPQNPEARAHPCLDMVGDLQLLMMLVDFVVTVHPIYFS